MRLIYYILISIVFFTSCKSSFTKRHYRPGVFRENIKDKDAVSLSKQNKYNLVSTSKIKSYLNLSLNNSDSVVKCSYQFGKSEVKVSSIKRIHLTNSKKLIHPKIKIAKTKRTVLLEDANEEKVRKARNWVGIAILICAIFFGIGLLIVGFQTYLGPAIMLVFVSAVLGITLIIAFLILEIIRQSLINKRVKNEKIKLLTNKELSRFKKNYNKLKSLNVVCSIFISIGLLFFLVTEEVLQTALAWAFMIGLVIAFFITIRLLIMMYEYKKHKGVLSEEEIKNYKKVRNFSLVIALLFIAMMLTVLIAFTFV